MRILFTGVYSHLYGGLERFAERAAAALDGYARILSSALSLQKYEFRTLTADEASAVASGLDRGNELALVKDE